MANSNKKGDDMSHKALKYGCLIGLAIGLVLAFLIGSGGTSDYMIESIMLYGGGGLFIGSFIGLKLDAKKYDEEHRGE